MNYVLQGRLSGHPRKNFVFSVYALMIDQLKMGGKEIEKESS